MTNTNGSISPFSALKNAFMKSSPTSYAMSGQYTLTLGNPGMTPSAMSSMLGCVAAVSDTESPSQLRPALIHSKLMVRSGEGIAIVASTLFHGREKVVRRDALVNCSWMT